VCGPCRLGIAVVPRSAYKLGPLPRDDGFCRPRPASEAKEHWLREVAPQRTPSGSVFERVLFEVLRLAGVATEPESVVVVPAAEGGEVRTVQPYCA
jgi:hypothetical protein